MKEEKWLAQNTLGSIGLTIIYNGCFNLRLPSLQGAELPALEIAAVACISFRARLWGWQEKKWPL